MLTPGAGVTLTSVGRRHWSATGFYNSGSSGYYETIVYTCSGTNLNNYLLIYSYQDYYFSDYCGPVEP